MKQFEAPYLELILLKGDVIVTSVFTEPEEENKTGETGDSFNP